MQKQISHSKVYEPGVYEAENGQRLIAQNTNLATAFGVKGMKRVGNLPAAKPPETGTQGKGSAGKPITGGSGDDGGESASKSANGKNKGGAKPPETGTQ